MSLSGKKIVFTGTLSMKRPEAKKKAQAAGATVQSACNGQTDIAVCGPGAGQKKAYAESLGVEIWDEDEFVAAISGGKKGAKKRKASEPPKGSSSKKKKEVEEEEEDEDEDLSEGALKKMKVAELKEICARLGVSTAGTKATLIQAIVEANESVLTRQDCESMTVAQLKAKIVELGGSARGTKPTLIATLLELQDGDDEDSEEESEEEEEEESEEEEDSDYTYAELNKMKVRELQGICEENDLNSSGTKAVLIKRILGEEEEEKKEAKPKAEAKKEKKSSSSSSSSPSSSSSSSSGGAKPDRELAGRENYFVWKELAVKLNQTNLGGGDNNNKYYILQMLRKGPGRYYVWTRWGRVGAPGQNLMMGPFTDEEKGFAAFKKKFKDKTANHWDDRADFVKVKGKYQLVETEDGDGGDDDSPLGRLSKGQIEKGQAVLSQIDAALKGKKSRSVLEELSSTFFSLIPTNFGWKRPPPILKEEELHAKEELLKFYLRMGFEDMEEEEGLTPIAGVMERPVPKTLKTCASSLCASSEITNCVTKGQDLKSKNAGAPPQPMSADLYASILLYTSNAIYRDLNSSLRSENRSAVRRYYDYLRLLFEAMNSLPKKNVTLWRGISVDLFDQYKVGEVITWWGVSSCTADESVARNFMNGCGGNCSLLIVKTKTATDISEITFYSNEKESLLAPGTQLKVLKSERKGKVSEIQLEEVGRCVG